MISVNIKAVTSSGPPIPVSVDSDATVADLKQAAAPGAGAPADRLRLVFRGHVLQDGETLSSRGD